MHAPNHFRHLPLVLALQAAFTLQAHAAGFTIGTGTTVTANQALSAGAGAVESGAAVVTSGSTVAVTVGTGTSTLVNRGTINQTGSGRTIDANTSGQTFTLTNEIGGVINSTGDVAIRLGQANGIYSINNQGTISYTGLNAGGARGIKADADYANNVQIINGSTTNSAATISSNGDDALRIGSKVTLINYGNIISTSAVNTSCPDYMASSVGCGPDVKAGDGVAIEDARTKAAIINYGTITGPRHGVDAGKAGPVADTNLSNGTLTTVARLTVTSADSNGVLFTRVDNTGAVSTNVRIDSAVLINNASGVITGKNGSGFGSDRNGVVINYGTITGNYAGAGNAYNHAGAGITVDNGDGDGVDIDGVAYVENWGSIRGTGAGGLDSGGQPNGADGVAAGGGMIINHAGATIYGQSKGILIDDGADWAKKTGATGNTDADYVSGNRTGRGTAGGIGGTNVTIINDGAIIGDKKSAVGLVGDYGDTLVNNATGVITGGAQATLLGAGKSELAGAAVQMGGGADTLTNYGRIEGKNGMAIDMGDGDDTLQLLGGIVIGTIDGGAGTNDTLETGGTQVFNSGIISNFENFIVRNGSTTFNYGLGNVNSVQIDAGAALRVDGALSTSMDLTVNGTFRATTSNDVRTVNVGRNFEMGAGGVLETGLGAGNSADKISVVGTGRIYDGATIVPVAKAYVNSGSTYTIVSTTGTLTATPTGINVIDSAMVDYSLSKVGNDLVLNAQRTGTLASVAGSVAGGLGATLDSLAQSNPEAAKLLGALDNLPTQQAVRDAVQQLAPETNNASRQATNAGSNAVFSAFESRIDSARSGPLASANTGIAAGDNNRRAWLQGLGSWGEQDPRAGATGYKIGAYGVAGGFETDIAARDVAGVSLGYTNAYTTGTGVAVGDDAKVKAVSVGGYFSRTETEWTLDASLIAGYNSYRSERQVAISGFNETAYGNYNGWQVGGRVEVGFPFAMSQTLSGRWLVGARAGYLSTDSYTETGNAAITQSVGSAHANSFQPTFGVELNQAMSDQGRLQLRARYLREMADNPDIQATFVAGGPSFIAPGVKPNRDAVQLGIGYRWATATGSFITLGYDAEFREKSLVNQVVARASWAF